MRKSTFFKTPFPLSRQRNARGALAKAQWAFATPSAEKACLFRKRSMTKRKERFFKTPFLLMPKETGFWMPKENHKGEIPFDPPAHNNHLFRMRSEGTTDRSANKWYCHSGLFLLVTKREHRPRMTAVRPTLRRKKTVYCAVEKKARTWLPL